MTNKNLRNATLVAAIMTALILAPSAASENMCTTGTTSLGGTKAFSVDLRNSWIPLTSDYGVINSEGYGVRGVVKYADDPDTTMYEFNVWGTVCDVLGVDVD